MTPKDKLRALLAKAEELEAKATKAPWSSDSDYLIAEVPNGRPGGENIAMFAQYPRYEKVNSKIDSKVNCEIAALSRNSFLPVLRLLVERLDECSRCCGTGVSLDKGYGFCSSCTPRYAALCAELEKLGVI